VQLLLLALLGQGPGHQARAGGGEDGLGQLYKRSVLTPPAGRTSTALRLGSAR